MLISLLCRRTGAAAVRLSNLPLFPPFPYIAHVSPLPRTRSDHQDRTYADLQTEQSNVYTTYQTKTFTLSGEGTAPGEKDNTFVYFTKHSTQCIVSSRVGDGSNTSRAIMLDQLWIITRSWYQRQVSESTPLVSTGC